MEQSPCEPLLESSESWHGQGAAPHPTQAFGRDSDGPSGRCSSLSVSPFSLCHTLAHMGNVTPGEVQEAAQPHVLRAPHNSGHPVQAMSGSRPTRQGLNTGLINGVAFGLQSGLDLKSLFLV